jgi:hypothetical protein
MSVTFAAFRDWHDQRSQTVTLVNVGTTALTITGKRSSARCSARERSGARRRAQRADS